MSIPIISFIPGTCIKSVCCDVCDDSALNVYWSHENKESVWMCECKKYIVINPAKRKKHNIVILGNKISIEGDDK